jgi:hypothetical protein
MAGCRRWWWRWRPRTAFRSLHASHAPARGSDATAAQRTLCAVERAYVVVARVKTKPSGLRELQKQWGSTASGGARNGDKSTGHGRSPGLDEGRWGGGGAGGCASGDRSKPASDDDDDDVQRRPHRRAVIKHRHGDCDKTKPDTCHRRVRFILKRSKTHGAFVVLRENWRGGERTTYSYKQFPLEGGGRRNRRD